MKALSRQVKLTLIFTFTFGLAACGSDGGGGDGDGFTPTLPANALRITRANAAEVASTAVGSLDSVTILTDAGSALKPATGRPSDAEIARWLMHRAIRGQFFAAREVSEPCGPGSNDGQVTGDVNESGNRVDGEFRFEQCNLGGSGLLLEGRLDMEGTVDENSGDYDLFFNSRIAVSFGNEPTVTLTFDARDTGNAFSGAFSLDTSISISGIPGGGYLLDTTDPLTGNTNSGTISDGTLVVYGSDDSRLRLDVTMPDFVDIDIDEGSGNFEDYDEVDLNLL